MRAAEATCAPAAGSAPGVEPLPRTPTAPHDYAALSAGYGALLGAAVLAARGREDDCVPHADLPVLGLASFALSKLLVREKVESWVREPFVEETPDGERRPKGRGLRYAVGELLTCTRCTGAWSSLALVGLRATRPREARVVNAVLAVSALNDLLHASFSTISTCSNRAEAELQEVQERVGRHTRPVPAPNGAGT